MLNGPDQDPIVLQDLETITAAQLPWTRFQGKKILISGVAGFLPAYLAETLLYLNDHLGLNCTVIGLVRNLTKARIRHRRYKDRSDLKLIECDLSLPIKDCERCDFIIHAASQASPKYYGSDPAGTMATNLQGIISLLDFGRKWQIEGFLYFSSGEVYGEVRPEQVPTLESEYGYIDILNPRSCYAESKRAAETYLVSCVRQFGLPAVIVRPFHTYGPGMALDDGRVFADFVRDAVHGKDLVINSDGKAIRAFCYLSDATQGFFTALLKGESGQAYNIGNPAGTMSIQALAEMIVGLYPARGIKVVRRIPDNGSYLPSKVSVVSPNIERIRRLGWTPHFPPAAGFDRTIRYFSAANPETSLKP